MGVVLLIWIGRGSDFLSPLIFILTIGALLYAYALGSIYKEETKSLVLWSNDSTECIVPIINTDNKKSPIENTDERIILFDD